MGRGPRSSSPSTPSPIPKSDGDRMPTLGRRRALGQHFLKDANIARLIAETAVEEARAHGCPALLEIGPGRGAITDPLLALVARPENGIREFVLCERDQKIANDWKARRKERD